MVQYDIITFDCYGTLIDWEGGMVAAFRDRASEEGIDLQPKDILRAYAAVERAVEQEFYRSYGDVLAEASFRVAHMLGWRIDEHSSFLAASLPSWKPFPDTNPALERLRRAGIGLGILSNVDDDLLAATRRHLTVDFEVIITAEQARSYKPRFTHFLMARQRVGNARWLHAAQSNFHDIVPTNQLGIPNAWINRHHAPVLPGGTPTHEFANLTELADAMT